MNLAGKRIVVIGASSGMGLAAAARFHQAGAHVARVIAARLGLEPDPGPFRYRHLGDLATIGRHSAVIDVGGVGYIVQCASSTLSRLHVGATVSLAIETRLSEEAIRLYGFLAAEEREWFRLLQTVQGVGAKVALAILSAVRTDEPVRARAAQHQPPPAPARARPGAARRGPRAALRLVGLPADLRQFGRHGLQQALRALAERDGRGRG